MVDTARWGASWRGGEARAFAPSDGVGARPRPVFLHGMWRSGSTYLWSRFRAAPDVCCFYEPLHHGLAKLTRRRIARDTPEQISANRHPALAQPYFAEFAPLIERRGVRGYHPQMAYDRFVLRPGEAHPPLERYIENLLDHAASRGETAVLGFNRTGLRLAWLKARFCAYTIHIDREPAAIWASYAAEAAKGNHAFFCMWLAIVEKNAAHPLFAPVADRLSLRRAPMGLGSAKARHRHIVEAMSPEESYFLIYYLWLACAGHALAEADLVIDTRLATDGAYARHVTARIAAAAGVMVDLSQMRPAEARTALSPLVQARIERSAAAIFPRATLPRALPHAPPPDWEHTRRAAQNGPGLADRLAAAF